MEKVTNIQWFPGHMMKTLRMIEASLKEVDVIIELLDARIPASSKNPELAELTSRKPRLLLLNKNDLADAGATARWIAYYKNNGYGAVAVSSKEQKLRKLCVEACSSLVKEKLERQSERGAVKTKLRAMVVGIPNVGKSTFINNISGKASTKTEDRPGVTRGKQWISLPEIELLDMPGVLWRKFEDMNSALKLSFTGAIKDDVLDVEEIACCLLGELKDRYFIRLAERYKLTKEEMPEKNYELLELIAKKRGMLISKGEYDTLRAANMLLDELRGGKLGRITFEEPNE